MKKPLFIIAAALLTLNYACDNSKTTTESTGIKSEERESVGNPADVSADAGTFQIKHLDYNYDAFPEYIDAKTMEIHYSKHYLGYINNMNKELSAAGNTSDDIVDILSNLDMNNTALRNNAGGYYNHLLYFDLLSANPEKAPTGELAEKIDATFGSLDDLIDQLKDAGAKQFGSGWSWLVVKSDGSLAVTATPNQDNPLMPGAASESGTPILGIDVWEHAYYLKYQNKRPEYLDNFFQVLDWKQVEANYDAAVGQ